MSLMSLSKTDGAAKVVSGLVAARLDVCDGRAFLDLINEP